MDHAWKTSMSAGFAETFDRFERRLGDCPDSMWEESLWDVTKADVPARRLDGAVLGAGRPEAERRQVFSAFWFIAWHALDCTHYDLEGLPLPAWAPPSPFGGDSREIDADYYLPLRVFTRSELQEYAADTRRKADETVASLTDERVARAIPAGHRYVGIPYASLLLMCLTHSREHLAQLEMFLGQRGVART